MNKHHLRNRREREIENGSDIRAVLKNGKYAVVSMCRDSEPYIVTLSYGYDAAENTLYFHCAKHGLKLDFIRANRAVCATVILDGSYSAMEILRLDIKDIHGKSGR